MRALDLTGKTFGRLTAKTVLGSWHGRRRWFCSCRCGNWTTVVAQDLTTGHIQSCGCQKRDNHLPLGMAALHSLYCLYRWQAKNRGYCWKLSEAELSSLTQKPCWYCGAAPASCKKSKNGNFIYNGLDRTDNTQGYTLDNVVPCCGQCNRAKDVMSVPSFLVWARQIVQRHEGDF
jgi:hypothetical protein